MRRSKSAVELRSSKIPAGWGKVKIPGRDYKSRFHRLNEKHTNLIFNFKLFGGLWCFLRKISEVYWQDLELLNDPDIELIEDIISDRGMI
ncbi:hypothetical protein JTB14_019979 [Gonioctena quinquepunctata]|nr:hypothetical protein JTB14_019979 [Gonioctena quinquepunctata]